VPADVLKRAQPEDPGRCLDAKVSQQTAAALSAGGEINPPAAPANLSRKDH